MNKITINYTVFILRAWAEENASAPSGSLYRFSLENVQNGERIGFPSLYELNKFLVQNGLSNDLPYSPIE